MEEKLSQKDLSLFLNVAQEAAFTAGNYLKSNFLKLKEKDIFYKKNNERVTKHDQKSEEIIKNIILKKFPNHNFLGEEENFLDQKNEFTWIVDPLDGTNNYTLNIPIWSISIGLAHQNDFILGVVYYPLLDLMFYGMKNKGAYLNNQKLKTPQPPSLKKSFVAFCIGNNKNNKVKYQASSIHQNLWPKIYDLRPLNSASLEICYICINKIQAFYGLAIKIWDVAAAVVIAKECGLKVTDLSGQEFNIKSKNLLVSHPKNHKKILSIIQKSLK